MPTLFRGFRGNKTIGTYKNEYMINPRKPLHTSLHIHQGTDFWFYNKFGIWARSTTIFCTTDIHQALKYGERENIRIIYPKQPYKIIYSTEIIDLYEETIQWPSNHTPDDIDNWLSPKNYIVIDCISKLPDSFKGEVMIYCDEYEVKGIEA